MYLAIFPLIFLVFSSMYNYIMLNAEKHKFTPPGRLIKIDDHKMHIVSRGEGKTTVIMTSGCGTLCPYTDFYKLESKVSEFTRTCLYDRPGYGWSEYSKTSRDTERIAYDLKRLLEKAGEKPPYVFVAYSSGLMEALLFAHKYPSEVAGMVIIDGAGPYRFIQFSNSDKNKLSNLNFKFEVLIFKFLNFTGIIRLACLFNLIPRLADRTKKLPKYICELEKAMLFKNLYNRMILEERKTFLSTSLKMSEHLDIKNLPITIITADSSLYNIYGWSESQKSLLELSSNSKQIIIKNTNHNNILHDCHKEISDSIREIIINYMKNAEKLKLNRP